jgi:outer membrane protein assembly factor BamD
VSRLALAAAFVLSTMLAPIGCKSFETNIQDTDVDYAETAQKNFDEGEQAMADGRWAEAVKFFEHTKNKYPYSKFAVLAELRIADAHFSREKWLEAADSYRIFVRFHPRHDKVPYATFRVALAYSKEIDQDVWFFPTAVEKDQSAARDAIKACDEFLARFPDDKNAAEAKALRTQARARLAETDLYAASFYVEREKWQGALWRYQRVANQFADTPKAAFALLAAARIADEKLADRAQATKLYERLVRQHPMSPEADDARAALSTRKPAG